MNEVILEELERVAMAHCDERFFDIKLGVERHIETRTYLIGLLGRALGETLDTIKFPANWQRLLARKDCPKYMRVMQEMKVNVYYPKISIPETKHWITFDKGVIEEKNEN